MKNVSRCVSCLLLFASLSMVASCGNTETSNPKQTDPVSNQNDESTTEDVTTEMVLKEPELPERDFSGQKFTIMYRFDAHAYNVTDIWVESLNGEVINDAVYNRNIAFEDKFHVTLDPRPEVSPVAIARKEILADSVAFDLCGDRMKELYPVCTEGYFYDWNQLEYIDPEEVWWDSNAARELTINDSLYMMVGDFSMSASAGTSVIYLYFNKALMKEYDIEEPYDIAADGKWTFDKMYDMIRTVSRDLDGDGKRTAADCYGFLKQVAYRLMNGFDISFVTHDNDGKLQLTPLDNRYISAFEKVAPLLNDPVSTISYDDASIGWESSNYPNLYMYVRNFFTSDHFLFLEGGASIASEFSDMKSPYGILPLPKYDETQEEYHHPVDEYSVGWSIPVNAEDIEKTDILLEYFTYVSSRPLINAFYDVTLKYKRLESPNDVKMLDLVRSSTMYDVAYIVGVDIFSLLNSSLQNGDLVSTYETKKGSMQAVLDRVNKE